MKIIKDKEIMPAVKKKLAEHVPKKHHFLSFSIKESKNNQKQVDEINALLEVLKERNWK